ncbi:hypothetical protein FLM48_17665 [Shewanella sp. Scap07]|uniref:FlxA-like family protein n=1 Tax=Shewanella sp. Scap07 TaxID=2589987 RepID=UPI0015C105BF|nr:FlxA-like family protein [Shewanella sp. Scap07]QLE86736.1 hypothetical protein FLM48_17665 [Shewanella sp. Scap07]
MNVITKAVGAAEPIGDFSQLKIASRTTNQQTSQATSTSALSTTDNDVVQISAQAYQALASDSGMTLHAQRRANQQVASKESAELAPKDKLDELIDSLKQQVEELQKQLDELVGDRSEGADKQRKVLEAQLTSLLAQIAALTEQQLKQQA